MNTIVCAGGSGAKIVESLLHLCAAGLGPRSLRILAVDPDGSNGNGDRTRKLIDDYQACRRLLGNRQMGEGVNWFGTELDLLDPNNKDMLQVWSPIKSGQSLRKVLNFDVLETTDTPSDVVRLLFTDKELNLTLDQGFRGHPSIGAACMSLLTLQAERDPAWALLLEKIKADIGLPEGSRVVIRRIGVRGNGRLHDSPDRALSPGRRSRRQCWPAEDWSRRPRSVLPVLCLCRRCAADRSSGTARPGRTLFTRHAGRRRILSASAQQRRLAVRRYVVGGRQQSV